MYDRHRFVDLFSVRLPELKRRLARRVRELRRQHGLRQDDLESFGLAWKTIQKIEAEQTDPKASTLLKLCRAFKIELADLVDESEDPRG